MKKTTLLILLVLQIITVYAQIPAGYYNSATDSGYVLKTQLYTIIRNHSVKSYDNLWQYFDETDIDASDGFIYDVYSENPNGTDPYNFTYSTNQCGNYSQEGDCYNREHIMPKSWFNDGTPMESDIHHILPTDGFVNNIRANYPFGETNAPTKTTQNGSKLGNGTSGLGYTSLVFEPLDDFKGDMARIYFYMATRYENVINGWSSPMFDGSKDKVFTSWALSMLIKWHQNDPINQKEIDRNNEIYYNIQNNRNPFVDHPEYVEKIWGSGTYCLATKNLQICTGESIVIGGIARTQEGTFSEIIQGTSCDTIKYTILSFIEVDTLFTRIDDKLFSTAQNASFQWYNCADNLPIAGATNSDYIPINGIGNYALEITQNGCTYKTKCYDFTKLAVAQNLVKQLVIYPNPTSGVLILKSEFLQTNDECLKIYSILGKLIKEVSIKNSNEITLDVSDFENGIYLIEFQSKMFKFIKN